jgi:scyllo-inositol 2-dehydrogenase (NADP+)
LNEIAKLKTKQMTQRKITTALLSYGMSGEVFHGPLLEAHSGFEIVSVYQRDHSKQSRHNYHLAHSPSDIFKDPSIALVVVNTPNETHFKYAMEALKAGKHVIVEKPFTVSVKEADELISFAKKQNLILTVFQNRRWDGDFLTLQKVLSERLVGTLVEIEMHYDRFRNYIDSNSWKEESNPGVGILYNLGSHMLDQVLLLFGKPDYVNASMGIQRPQGKVNDYYDIRMQYAGFNVIVKSSYLVREPGPRYSVHGTEGSYIKYANDPQEQALKEKQIPGSPGWGSEHRQWWGKLNTTLDSLHFEGQIETLHGNYLGFYDNVYQAIVHGGELTVKPEQARNVIRLIEACIQSDQEKRSVKVDYL